FGQRHWFDARFRPLGKGLQVRAVGGPLFASPVLTPSDVLPPPPPLPDPGVFTNIEDNRFRFTGEELDDFSRRYYLRARWYDLKIVRFVSRDSAAGNTSNKSSSMTVTTVSQLPAGPLSRY